MLPPASEHFQSRAASRFRPFAGAAEAAVLAKPALLDIRLRQLAHGYEKRVDCSDAMTNLIRRIARQKPSHRILIHAYKAP
jgi:hypothetical protein